MSACPAVQPSPLTNGVFIQLEELQSAVFGKIGRLGTRRAGWQLGTPSRQPCCGGRQLVLWAGLQVAQDRLPLELCSSCARSSATPSSLNTPNFLDGRRAQGSLRKPGRPTVGHQRPAGRRHRSPVGRVLPDVLPDCGRTQPSYRTSGRPGHQKPAAARGIQVLPRNGKVSLIVISHPRLQVESRNRLFPLYFTTVSYLVLFKLLLRLLHTSLKILHVDSAGHPHFPKVQGLQK